MITKVYIWPTGLKNKDKVKKSSSIDPFNLGWYWGHVAIEIPDPNDKHVPLHYWSYWPPSMKPNKSSIYYPDDRTSCGDARAIIEIENLDIDSMEKIWDKELKKDFHDYNHNCCTVTVEILRGGFTNSYFNDFGTFAKRSWRMVTSPFSTFLLSTTAIASDVMVWSPSAVEDFAKYIKKISK